jgi:cytoskeletal protein RodZ
VFENKKALLKEEITPLQEQLLLYVDDELKPLDKAKVQQLINSNVAAAKEFSILQKTKIQPDAAVVFTNKNILYKKEKGRVVPIVWLRVAVAAVLLGFGTWATFTFITPAQQSGQITATVPEKIEQTTANTGNGNNTVQQQTVINSIDKTVASLQQPVAVKQKMQNNNTPAANTAKQNLPQQIRTDVIVKETNNLPKPLYNNFNNNNRNETAIANVPLTESATDKVKSGTTELVASLTKPNTEAFNGYAINAAFNQDNANDADDYNEEDKTKRTKLGFFIIK